nr:hypothetical protein 20 [Candidatus Hydrogenedentota bacterium]
MNITLQIVRDSVRDVFGRDSFVAGFIKRVEPSETCTTASINTDGVMKYNPGFVEEHITCRQDLFCLICHEMMHPMFSHFTFNQGTLENIGMDIVINACISILYEKPSGKGSLFRRLYPERGLEGLLRPDSRMNSSRYARLYDSFYHSYSSQGNLSTGETIQALKVLTPGDAAASLMLLGSHDGTGDGTGNAFSPEVLTRIASDLKTCAVLPKWHRSGYGEMLYKMFFDILKTHLTMKKVLLQKFVTRQKVDKFKQAMHRPRIGVSPIPIRPSKRDFILLAAGIPPFHYHNQAYQLHHQERGLAIYLDVSGSVNDYLPEIIGVMCNLKSDLKTILLFSNKVVEVPFKSLLKGVVSTTYGTDFDCIAEHILENKYDKAVILTDGYASMKKVNKEALEKQKVSTLTVLFGGKKECSEFAVFGDVVQLEDVTE